MRIVVASTYVPFHEGGAGVVDGLARELAARGHQTDTVRVPFSPASPNSAEQSLALRMLDLSESCGDRIDRLIALDAPSCALRHSHKAAWFIDHPRTACEPWESAPDDSGRRMTRRFRDLHLGECKKVFTHSRAAAARLKRLHNIDAAGVLTPPLSGDASFRPGPFGDYFFQPGRIRPVQRQALAIEAMRRARPEVRLVIGGAADRPSYLAELEEKVRKLGQSGRIELTGPLSDERTAEWMAGCRGVLDLTYGEDACDFTALRAFHSGKPVVTLTDSGAAEVVEDGVNGLVAAPEPRALAEALDCLWTEPEGARRMGEAARGTPARRRIDWDHVVESLIS